MPLTLPEILSDLPAAAALIPVVEASIAKLNAGSKTPGAYCVFASEVLTAAAPLVDVIAEQAKS